MHRGLKSMCALISQFHQDDYVGLGNNLGCCLGIRGYSVKNEHCSFFSWVLVTIPKTQLAPKSRREVYRNEYMAFWILLGRGRRNRRKENLKYQPVKIGKNSASIPKMTKMRWRQSSKLQAKTLYLFEFFSWIFFIFANC